MISIKAENTLIEKGYQSLIETTDQRSQQDQSAYSLVPIKVRINKSVPINF